MLKRATIALFLACATAGAQHADTVASSAGYWRRLGAGVATSILLHEAAHVTASFTGGAHPSFGFDKARPTVYSGIDVRDHPRRQFWFSAAGLTVQSLLDEAILDVPHARGGAFERGLLAGGIGTTVFYLTIGRTGAVSDVEYMARTRVMSKTQITMLYGAIAAAHSWRVATNPVYDHFFVAPHDRGLRFGYRR